MKVIVVGAGKVGFYLAKTLLEHGHTPLVIEQDPVLCRRAADRLGITVIRGDGSSADTLGAAGAQGADAIVTATGADQVNLIACQTARRIFGVKRTLSRVNNPNNLKTMRQLGVDIPVSSTDILARTLEREVDASAIQSLLSLNRGEATISQFILPEDSPMAGVAIKDLRLPNECVLISITRAGELIIPRGPTLLQAGDKVLVLVGASAIHQLKAALGVGG
jgi:trk system potassium uptake protein TrkA